MRLPSLKWFRNHNRPFHAKRRYETGYVWTWLSEACEPSFIAPERILVVGDDDAVAMARVVDLVEHGNGTIVHVEILRGTVAG